MAFGHISAMVRSASSNHYATQNDRFLLPLDNFGKGQQKKVRVEVDLEACWWGRGWSTFCRSQSSVEVVRKSNEV